MKILLINKFHYCRGGAERAYFDLAKILTDHGHEVAFFSMRHPLNLPTKWSKYFIDNVDYFDQKLSWGKKIIAVFNFWYNFQAARRLRALLKEFRPDVAHLHNIYHQLSPSIIDVLAREKIPMVMTLHDYKLVSPNYKLLARGEVWERSKPDKFYRCLIDKCVEDSYAWSLICTIEAYLHRLLKIYQKINLFISPSKFLQDKFKEYRFRSEIVYLPNPIFLDQSTLSGGQPDGDKYILYFGRLSREKGIVDLLRAHSRLETKIKLKIVGAGPQMAELQKIVAEEKFSHVELLGYQAGDELWRQVRGAETVIVPSRWYENAPYSVIEAMAMGKVVIASNFGGLTELIDDGTTGFLFKPGDVADLQTKIDFILSHPELKESIGARAAAAVKAKNDPEIFYQAVLALYQRLAKV